MENTQKEQVALPKVIEVIFSDDDNGGTKMKGYFVNYDWLMDRRSTNLVWVEPSSSEYYGAQAARDLISSEVVRKMRELYAPEE